MNTKVVFMGTPDFAVPSLQALLDNGYQVQAVYTQPDKPKGRRYVLTPSPVKELALKYGIPVCQPTSLKDPAAWEALKALEPDFLVVAAYGRILPQQVLDIPRFCCVNVHGSLLPKYRGAAPIQWSVIHGEPVTGVTTMRMDKGVDTGDILLQREVALDENMTSGGLYDLLAPIGAALLIETLKGVEEGTVSPRPQEGDKATFAPMLDKNMAELDFSLPARQVHNRVRGLNPWPVAQTAFQGHQMKLYETRVGDRQLFGRPGQVFAEKSRLFVLCGDNGGQNSLEILELALEGGKRMAASSFLAGHKIAPGTFLGR